MNKPSIQIGPYLVGKGAPLLLLSGPCVIESEEHTLYMAEKLISITKQRDVSFVFKASYDKANRSSYHSFRGPGLEEGLRILQKVQRELGIPVVTDVHTVEEAKAAGEVVDLLQIPAFLCRQTDLVVAAAATGKPVMIKKGQFVSPWDMGQAVEKVRATGNHQVMLCDRGTSFGYNNLVSDMRAIPVMQGFGVPVVFDASHATQLPGSLSTATGGQREFIPTLSRAAVAAGCDGLFIETHNNPAAAKSDAATVFPLEQFPALLDLLLEIYAVVQKNSFATHV
jgi:2-dehydro-3-deoxyphosphooctonate aldolase (KDO 8-P synthase)